MGNPISGQSKSAYAGDRLRALRLNRMDDSDTLNRAALLTMGLGGGLFPGGAVLIANPPPPSAPPSIFPPWYPFITGSSGSHDANFYPGTVGGIVPSNMFTPVGLTDGDVNYLYLEVTASGGIVTGATIAVSTTYPTLAASNSGSPPSSFNIPIAIFDLSGSSPAVYNTVGFGNIWVQPYVSLLTTAVSPTVLTAPFTVTYNWTWGAGS